MYCKAHRDTLYSALYKYQFIIIIIITDDFLYRFDRFVDVLTKEETEEITREKKEKDAVCICK